MSSESRNLRPPSKVEGQILRKLLAEGFQGRDVLLAQTKHLQVEHIDPEGSLRLVPGADVQAAVVEDRVPVEAELSDDDGITIRLLLHVVDGLLAELEVYKDDLTPIHKPLQPENLLVNHGG